MTRLSNNRVNSSYANNTVSVLDFGADPTGVSDSTAGIQAAIDAANASGGGTVLVPDGTYLLGKITYPGTGAAGVCGIVLKDNVTLRGQSHNAILKVADGTITSSGTLYRAITSFGYDASEAGLSNGAIENLTIDGNKANQTASVQATNIKIEPLSNVRVRNIRSINANGNAIMVSGKTTLTPAKGIIVEDCYVDAANTIGIQCAQFDGLQILNNKVYNCTDNGIDVYGEDGTTTPHAYNFLIANNYVDNCLTGVFLETVSDGIAQGNVLKDCTYGVAVNRINGAPSGLLITNNIITDATDSGIRCTGDSQGNHISNNSITGAPSGIKFGNGTSGNASYYRVINNFFKGCTSVIDLDTTGNITHMYMRGNWAYQRTDFTTWLDVSTGPTVGSSVAIEDAMYSGLSSTGNVNSDLRNTDAFSSSNEVELPFLFRNSGNIDQEFTKVVARSSNPTGGAQQGECRIEVLQANAFVEAIVAKGNTLGFYDGSTPVAKQTVTGSKGGNAALTDLLTKLANLGLITDSTT